MDLREFAILEVVLHLLLVQVAVEQLVHFHLSRRARRFEPARLGAREETPGTHTSSRLERLCRTQVTLRSGGGRLASAHRKLRMTGVCAAPGWSNTCVSHCCSSAHATLSCSGACVLLSSTVQCCSGQGATVIIVARCSESALNVERRLTGQRNGRRAVSGGTPAGREAVGAPARSGTPTYKPTRIAQAVARR